MNQTELQEAIRSGTLDQAAAKLEQERAEANANGKREDAALASNDLGVVYLLLKRDAESRELLQQAQRMFIELNDTAGQGRAVGNLAQLEERAGNADAAGALYMQAADLLHEGNAFEDEYVTRRRLSRFYFARGATLLSFDASAKALAVKPNATLFDRIQRWMYQLPLRLMGIGS